MKQEQHNILKPQDIQTLHKDLKKHVATPPPQPQPKPTMPPQPPPVVAQKASFTKTFMEEVEELAQKTNQA